MFRAPRGWRSFVGMMSDNRRVVVVGSGPAGAMAAYELARRGIPVTMLETGEDTQRGALVRMAGRTLYRRPSSHDEGERLRRHRRWTGPVPCFCPEDFTAGERVHEKYRWPASCSDLAPCYEVAERVM